ncbi:MAG: helix-turn-helix transcriptional regulator [Euryarchaeota archaeon]|nr:helix-turn-helix transcriptional regulator [Euryarchaeota archaeon]MDE1835772.1 helix-turn-helix transcriptional regulator [Euryarchaeota archaeon]MDE1881547.1 helix-turn-helix transcriptional regulator [Euryarchaeota archaeon]MDE2043963.1 helix-turn-helix transcriptional regulator [Thermoplasmata archaeon]
MTAASQRRTHVRVRLNFLAYPMQSSLGVLGRRWAFLILMHIAMGQAQRFNQLLRKSPGMGKRILAMRLRELEELEFIVRVQEHGGHTIWRLTPKGQDVLPVMLTLIHFASKWRATEDPSKGPSPSLAREFDVVVHQALSRPRSEVRK